MNDIFQLLIWRHCKRT